MILLPDIFVPKFTAAEKNAARGGYWHILRACPTLSRTVTRRKFRKIIPELSSRHLKRKIIIEPLLTAQRDSAQN